MRSKHEIPNKTDYMKAYTFNLIETERTNCELENERNVGKIDGAFYRNFSWQIMGKQRERHLSQTDANDLVEAKRHEALSGSTPLSNETQHEKSRCQEAKNDVLIESRTDFMGTAPKKYVSTCYFKPRTVPAWYTECILIHIGSTKRIYDEKIWFKQKLQPYYWTEKMTTTVNFPPTKAHFSDLTIPNTTTGISIHQPH
ncbi:hypothetical protein D910_06338 [Dendroctonus ponderosae]